MLAVAYVAVTGSLMVSYSRAKAESLGYENKVGYRQPRRTLPSHDRYAYPQYAAILP